MEKRVLRGEVILPITIVINALAVRLMIQAGGGISAISSVPYAISEAFPFLTLGTWTYLFQGTLVLSLMVLRRKFVPQYLLSFVVGFFFGITIDIHDLWVARLPGGLGWSLLWFCLSYCCMCVGISVSNRCKTPIVPTDLFPREVSFITGAPYSRVKTMFDLSCLATTILLTLLFLGHIEGLGIGTVVAACTVGKGVGLTGEWVDKRFEFVSSFGKA